MSSEEAHKKTTQIETRNLETERSEYHGGVRFEREIGGKKCVKKEKQLVKTARKGQRFRMLLDREREKRSEDQGLLQVCVHATV